MRILLTGVAGFIGFHTAKKLIEDGHEIIGIDNLNVYYEPQLKKDRLGALGVRLEEGRDVVKSTDGCLIFYKGDICNRDLLQSIIRENNIESVIHLAAQAGVRYSIENPEVYIESNLIGFFNILEACRLFKIGTLTYASSSSVYGNNSEQPFSEEQACDKPISLYAATKRSNELMAHTYSHLYSINAIGLRFFTVYGPWGRPDMAPMLFTKAALEGKPVKVFNNGNQYRDFTYVDDIVEGVVKAHKKNFANDNKGEALVMNIGNGSPVALMEFIGQIERATNKELIKEYVEAQPGDVSLTYADTTLLKEYTDYLPVTEVKAGVDNLVNWYKSYYHG